jgi:hypothetical protein
VTEHAGGEAIASDDDARVLRWIGELRVADRGEREVADRAPSLPALEPALGEDALGPGRRIEAREGGEPFDTRQPVTGLAAAFCIEEVLGEDGGVALLEPERPQPGEDVGLGQLRTGRGLIAPGGRVARIASATAAIATAASASG